MVLSKGVLSQQSLFSLRPHQPRDTVRLRFRVLLLRRFHFICLHVCVGVAVSVTFLAVTGPHVPRQECWDVEVSQLRAQRPAFAPKAEVVSGPTFWSGTSIWEC